MIRPYSNDHKTPRKLKVNSGNKIINCQTQYGQWKIQLTISINFISSKDSDETCNMRIQKIII